MLLFILNIPKNTFAKSLSYDLIRWINNRVDRITTLTTSIKIIAKKTTYIPENEINLP